MLLQNTNATSHPCATGADAKLKPAAMATATAKPSAQADQRDRVRAGESGGSHGSFSRASGTLATCAPCDSWRARM